MTGAEYSALPSQASEVAQHIFFYRLSPVSHHWQLVAFSVFFCQVRVSLGVGYEAFLLSIEFESAAYS
ncbi:MAG: hypothetical protein ACYTGS_21035, partial [Planctomycetota bacterium]